MCLPAAGDGKPAAVRDDEPGGAARVVPAISKILITNGYPRQRRGERQVLRQSGGGKAYGGGAMTFPAGNAGYRASTHQGHWAEPQRCRHGVSPGEGMILFRPLHADKALFWVLPGF